MGNTLPTCASLAVVFTSLQLQLNPKVSMTFPRNCAIKIVQATSQKEQRCF